MFIGCVILPSKQPRACYITLSHFAHRSVWQITKISNKTIIEFINRPKHECWQKCSTTKEAFSWIFSRKKKINNRNFEKGFLWFTKIYVRFVLDNMLFFIIYVIISAATIVFIHTQILGTFYNMPYFASHLHWI